MHVSFHLKVVVLLTRVKTVQHIPKAKDAQSQPDGWVNAVQFRVSVHVHKISHNPGPTAAAAAAAPALTHDHTNQHTTAARSGEHTCNNHDEGAEPQTHPNDVCGSA